MVLLIIGMCTCHILSLADFHWSGRKNGWDVELFCSVYISNWDDIGHFLLLKWNVHFYLCFTKDTYLTAGFDWVCFFKLYFWFMGWSSPFRLKWFECLVRLIIEAFHISPFDFKDSYEIRIMEERQIGVVMGLNSLVLLCRWLLELVSKYIFSFEMRMLLDGYSED